MDVEISVPQTPVTLIPGAETRVPVDVCNRSDTAISLRFSMAANRAGAWAYPEPPVMELTPGDRAGIHVVFRPPADLPPAPTLQPFAVQAVNLGAGGAAGRGTGLVTVGAPERLTATLIRDTGNHRIEGYELALTNLGGDELHLIIGSHITPALHQLVVTPATVDVPAGQTVAVRVRLRRRTPLIGPPARYMISVSCREVATAESAPPLAVGSVNGTVAPLLRPRAAAVLAVLVLAAVLAAALGWGWQPPLPGLR